MSTNEIDKKIRKGLPPRHDAAGFQVTRDIVIPAGTVLRAVAGDEFAAAVGLAPGMAGEFTVTIAPSIILTPAMPLKRVVSA